MFEKDFDKVFSLCSPHNMLFEISLSLSLSHIEKAFAYLLSLFSLSTHKHLQFEMSCCIRFTVESSSLFPKRASSNTNVIIFPTCTEEIDLANICTAGREIWMGSKSRTMPVHIHTITGLTSY